MFKLNYAKEDMKYHGFILKGNSDFYYGIDTETEDLIATSGHVEASHGYTYLYLYRFNDGQWIGDEVEVESTECQFESFPDKDFIESRSHEVESFNKYLEEIEGISFNEYDESIDVSEVDRIWERYYQYCYGLPSFVRNEYYKEEN